MDNDQDTKKPLQLAGRRLEVKKPLDQGQQVRQQFPHGRQKTVQVEIKRKRSLGGPAAAPAAAPAPAAAAPQPPQRPPLPNIAPGTPLRHMPPPLSQVPIAQGTAAHAIEALAPEASPALPPVAVPAPEAVAAEQVPANEVPAVEMVAAAPVAPVEVVPTIPTEIAAAAIASSAPVADEAPTPTRAPSAMPMTASGGGVATGRIAMPPPTTTVRLGQQRPGSGRQGGKGGQDQRTLTQSEQAARVRALQEALRGEQERQRQQIEDARRRLIEDEARRRKAEEDARLQAIEDERRRRADLERRRQEQLEGGPAAAVADPARRPAAVEDDKGAAVRRLPVAGVPGRAVEDDDSGGAIKRAGGLTKRAPAKPEVAPRRADDRRRTGKLTVTQALSDNEQERIRSLASVRRAREKMRGRLPMQEPQKITREVTVPETITVQELANRMAERGANVIKALIKLGMMVTINQVIDADTAELVATEFGHKVRRVNESDVEIGMRGDADIEGERVSRPPVVTIMGHVDHGKTSLLDALRKTDVAAHEAGGITQHIGAYQVTMPTGRRITFIDTPGHAAFTEMRARGANVTDIVVLVVAADDGIMQQTIEAIAHAKAAKVPMIVAINKVDKPGADPKRVRTELLQHNVQVESMGGDVLDVEVSAKTGQNLAKLEETILLQAEVMDLRANPVRPAEGTIVEAKLEKGRGSVATVLIQRGTLRVGDVFVCGAEWGRVRAMVDDHGQRIEEAGPSRPVEVLGANGTPMAGDDFIVLDDETRAREIAAYRQRKRREKEAALALGARGTLTDMFAKIQAGEAKELAVVVKSDVQGSLEAIIGSLHKLGTDEVKVRALHTAVGAINESDITLAKASGAVIIGFNVRANPQARDLARRDGVDIRYYSIIYNVVDDIKAMMSGMLAPTMRETFLGNVEIREVFNITKVGKVAGCFVTEGKVVRGAKVRILRDNVVVHEGKLKSLKRFKDEVKEVAQGFECGLAFETCQDFQAGDVVECFDVEEVARQL